MDKGKFRENQFVECKKSSILIFVAHYLPGYKSGGPLRTIANTVDCLGNEFDFKIIAADRDPTDIEAYPNIAVNQWTKVGKAQVYYISPNKRTLRVITKLIRTTAHDAMYLNSFFNPAFTMLPLLARWLCRIQEKPIIIAPRGEFSDGALALKQWKKKPFIFISKMCGLYRDLIWQASSKYEEQDIRKYIGKSAKHIVIAPDLPLQAPIRKTSFSRKPYEPLKIVFLSRITPKKNLDFALRVLKRVRVPVMFNIYGPIRDKYYWKTCQELIKSLPSQVIAQFHGPVTPTQVPDIMAAHDLFFLPTLGENYGHVIAEALSSGTPILIANTTPWRELEKACVGWDIDLNNIDAFVHCIEYCAKLTIEEYSALRVSVKQFADMKLNDPIIVMANRRMFKEVAKRMAAVC